MKPLILFAILAPASLTAVAHAEKTAAKPAAASEAAKSGAAPGASNNGGAKADMAKHGAPARLAPHTHADGSEGEPGHTHDDEPVEKAEPFGPNETNTEYFWRRSDKAFHDGDYEGAVALHRAIVALDPTDTESFGVAAWLLWSMGKADEANAHLKRGLDANPQNSDMWNEAAQQYDLQKKLPEAKDAYVNALKFAPANENTMMLRRRLAHAAEKAGDRNLSLETWRGLVKDFPNDPVNKNNLARVEKGNSVTASLFGGFSLSSVARAIGSLFGGGAA